jgi:hypothetical protein
MAQNVEGLPWTAHGSLLETSRVEAAVRVVIEFDQSVAIVDMHGEQA